MARVVLTANMKPVTGGVTELDLEAKNVRQLFKMLEERYPGLKPYLAEGLAVAIDGQIYQDALLEPIEPDSEVFLLPAIGGGAGA